MNVETKKKIENCLRSFSQGSLTQNSLRLFEALGYDTDRQAHLNKPGYAEFKDAYVKASSRFNEKKTLTDEWKSVDLLFQLSQEEISKQVSLFDTKRVDDKIYESYLFFAIELTDTAYSRTALSQITREINKLFPMPVMILFKTSDHLTLSIINRRLHKRDESKDVLEKVTLIKDISIDDPHRAHVEILFDLSFNTLLEKYKFTNFVELHEAWRKTLDIKELNKRFYQELSNWYFWAMKHVSFPDDIQKDSITRNSTGLIRLITRVIFVWFIKEKELVPEKIFRETEIKGLLKDFKKRKSSNSYYLAILQNLFFGTLNQKMSERGFVKEGSFNDHKKEYGIKNLFRYADLFTISEKEALSLFKGVPFLNGGLFDCLDKENDEKRVIYVDGFSRNPNKRADVPDFLFFAEEQDADLNETYGTKNKRYRVKGLIDILAAYKFTVAENTPIEEEVALDPELLGKVFENLLASYNPETQTTARKQTGSFYTPREIVNYMVDESLKAYLKQALLEKAKIKEEDADAGLEILFSYTEREHAFSDSERKALIEAIDTCKILDPACGSGAFPMGILHKLVHILDKLDPDNKLWRDHQRQKAIKETEETFKLGDKSEREHRLIEINDVFENNSDDYGRKLFLIENCIFGIDIQPIAVQIAKLRFFISLVVDQKKQEGKENLGIRSLPNLETKFVAANTLIGLEKPKEGEFTGTIFDNQEIILLETKLKELRHRYFSAKTRKEKIACQKEDTNLRQKIAKLLEKEGWKHDTAKQIVAFDPYDQNASSPFFDAEWMFGLRENGDGVFDVVIGNPPYVRQEQIKEYKPAFKKMFQCFTGVADLFVYFYEKGLSILNPSGILTFISSNKYFRSGYGEKLRRFVGEEKRVLQLIDFGDAPVFDAIAYPCIAVIQNGKPNNGGKVSVYTWEPGPALEDFERVIAQRGFAMPQSELRADGWRLESNETLRLLDKLRKAGKPLGEYVDGKFYYGIKTGLNEAFVVDRQTRDRLMEEHKSSAEVLKPFLRGRDVKRWKVEFADQYLIKIESSENVNHPWSGKSEKEAEKIFEKTYPAIHKRFSEMRNGLIKREDQGKYFWELRSCAYWKEFEKPKIIYPDIAQSPEFSYDSNGYYLANTMYLLPTNEKSLLAILNSHTIFWLYNQLSTQIRGGFVRFIAQYVSMIPIAEHHSKLTDLVKLQLKGNNTVQQESRLDALVAHLYGLTLSEYTLILNDLKLSDEVRSACLGEFKKIAAGT